MKRQQIFWSPHLDLRRPRQKLPLLFRYDGHLLRVLPGACLQGDCTPAPAALFVLQLYPGYVRQIEAPKGHAQVMDYHLVARGGVPEEVDDVVVLVRSDVPEQGDVAPYSGLLSWFCREATAAQHITTIWAVRETT